LIYLICKRGIEHLSASLSSLSVGFKDIDPHDPVILGFEEMTKINNQFFTVFDMILPSREFASRASLQMIGIKPEDLTTYHFKETTHPDDLKRDELGLVSYLNCHVNFLSQKK
jgi:hypothetical protein